MGSELFGWIIMIGASYALICFFAWIGRGTAEALDESAHGDVVFIPDEMRPARLNSGAGESEQRGLAGTGDVRTHHKGGI